MDNYQYKVSDAPDELQDAQITDQLRKDGWEEHGLVTTDSAGRVIRQWRKPRIHLQHCPFCGSPGQLSAGQPHHDETLVNCSNTLCPLNAIMMPVRKWCLRKSANVTTPYAEKIRIPTTIEPAMARVIADLNPGAAFEIVVTN